MEAIGGVGLVTTISGTAVTEGCGLSGLDYSLGNGKGILPLEAYSANILFTASNCTFLVLLFHSFGVVGKVLIL